MVTDATRLEVPVSGDYTFHTASDDGCRVWIDGQLVIEQGLADGAGTINLMAGMHAIKVDFYQYNGPQYFTLDWQGPGFALQPLAADFLFHAVDTQAPTAPQNLAALSLAGSVCLSWNAASDDIFVTGYDVWRNGQFLGSTQTPTFRDTTANHAGGDAYTVIARDATGNLSAASEAVVSDPLLDMSPGVVYRSFAGAWQQLPDFAAIAPTQTGQAASIDLLVRPGDANYALQFTGSLEIQNAGEYTFYSYSDDGSRVWIDGQLVVDNDGLHPAQERAGTISLAPGMHTIEVGFMQGTGEQALSLAWQGPGFEKQALPAAGALFCTGVPSELRLAAPRVAMAGRKVALDARLFGLGSGDVQGVAFYRDVNGDGQLDSADVLIATDNAPDNGFSALVSTTGWGLGINRIFAQATVSGEVRTASAVVDIAAAAPLTLTWAGGDGLWDVSSEFWLKEDGTTSPWQEGADAVFTGAAGTIKIAGPISVKTLTFPTGGFIFTPATSPAKDRLVIASDGLTLDIQDRSAPTTINVPITGGNFTNRLLKIGQGTLVLGAANTMQCDTVIAGGIVALGIDNALPSTQSVQLGDASFGCGVLDLNGRDLTLAGLTTGEESETHRLFFDEVFSAGPATAKLTVNNAVDGRFAGFFAGDLAIDKFGAGKWIVAGSSINTGDVKIYDGTLQLDGGFTAKIEEVAGFGNPATCGNSDPNYWGVSLSSGNGPTACTIEEVSRTVKSDPVLADGWISAVKLAVSLKVSVQGNPSVSRTFGQVYEGFNPFRVDTIQNLITNINGSTYDPTNQNNAEWGVFNLGDKDSSGKFKYANKGITSLDTKVLVFEDTKDGDNDYDDFFYVVGVDSGDLAIDSNNDSTTHDPAPHHPTETTTTYIDDKDEDSGGGMRIAVQAAAGSDRAPIDVRVWDWTPGVTKVRFILNDTAGTSTPPASITGLTLWNAATGSTDQINFGQEYSPETSPLSLKTDGWKSLYVQASRAGTFRITMEVNALNQSGKWQEVDAVRITAVDSKGSDCGCGGTSVSEGQSTSSTQDLSSPVAPSRRTSSDGKTTSMASQPKVEHLGNAIAIVQGKECRIYDPSGTGWTARDGEQQGTLKVTGSGNNITEIIETRGGFQTVFSGFDAATPGAVKKTIDTGGNETTHAYDDQNRLKYSQHVRDGQIERAIYDYAGDSTDPQSITVQRANAQDGNGNLIAPATIESVSYTYNAGRVELAQIKNATGDVTENKYYRYSPEGWLTLELTGAAYERAAADSAIITAGGIANPTSDILLLPYADNYFEYDANGRITARYAGGTGCSCAGGQGKTTYDVTYSSFPDAPNAWYSKNTVTTWVPTTKESVLSTVVTYLNYRGDQLLRDVIADGSHTVTYNRYDANGNLVLTADASALQAVGGQYYNDALPDLVDFDNAASGGSPYLTDASGLFQVYTYYASTTAVTSTADSTDSATPGGVAGFAWQSAVAQGETQARTTIGQAGGAVLQSATTYFSHAAADGTTVYAVAAQTEYPDAVAGSSGEGNTTNYAYRYVAATNHVLQQTTILPGVAAEHNGPGVAVRSSTSDVSDAFGRTVWSKDAVGAISYTEYNAVTGAAVKRIEDVGSLTSADITDVNRSLLSGLDWSVTAGEHGHLVTTYAADAMGRTIWTEGPDGSATYTVYNDAAHETRTFRGTYNTATNIWTTIGPVEVSREDQAQGYSESLTCSWSASLASTTVSINGVNHTLPKGDDPLVDEEHPSANATIHSLSHSIVNQSGQTIASREYFSFKNTSGILIPYTDFLLFGQEGVNYLDTDYFYDAAGQLYSRHNADGSVTHTFYDGQGRVSSEWRGTSDVPDTCYFPRQPSDPSQAPDPRDFHTWLMQYPAAIEVTTDGMLMWKVSSSTYDAAGNTRTSTSYADATTSYTTTYQYDWQGRMTDVLSPGNVASRTEYNNLGQVRYQQTYADTDGDCFTVEANGHIRGPETGELRAQSEYFYDNLGRTYETRAYEVDVDPTTHIGTLGDYLTTETWYDAAGRTVKTANANGLFQKTQYDSLGRVAASYMCFDDAEAVGGYSAAVNLIGDTVIEESRTWYNTAGQAVASASYQRLPDTDVVGELTAANSYATASVVWYDGAGRTIASANYGREDVGNDAAWTHYVFSGTTGNLIDADADLIPDVAEDAAPVPYNGQNSSQAGIDFQLQRIEYNAAGYAYRTIDNIGRISETQVDALGRTVRTIQNFIDGTVEETDTACDLTTEYQYDSAGRMVTLTAINAKGGDEGTDPYNNVQRQETKYLYESLVNPSWQTAVVYPDSTDTVEPNSSGGWSIVSGTDHTFTDYDRLGRVTTTTDQRGIVHAYTFDTAGRLVLDAVENTAAALDAMGVDSDVLAIGRAYDDVGRLDRLTSYHDAAGETPANEVAYRYDGWGNLVQEWQAHEGSVDTQATPSVQYTYSDGLDSNQNSEAAKYMRLTEVIYPNGRTIQYGYGNAGTVDGIMSRLATISDSQGTLAAYDYLGAGTIAIEDYADIAVKLDYTGGDNGMSGFDRFGRVADQFWADYGISPETLDEYRYDYDRAGNRVSRTNVLNSALSETYGYDALDRLTSTERADDHDQLWGLDGLGNFGTFTDDGTPQTRTTNAENEIESITGGWITPKYDDAGNMISAPRTGGETTRIHYVFDAWNRLVKVQADSEQTPGTPGETLAEYVYDGVKRRVQKTLADGTAIDYFYNANWQLLEEQTQTPGEEPVASVNQYVWSPRYIDSPIVRYHDANTATNTGTIGDSVIYFATDANFNVTVELGGATGEAQKRFYYDAYGKATACQPNWTLPTAPTTDGPLYCGYFFDAETGNDLARNRYYSTSIATWLEEDPISADSNLYVYCRNDPISRLDSWGLQETPNLRYVHEFTTTPNELGLKILALYTFIPFKTPLSLGFDVTQVFPTTAFDKMPLFQQHYVSPEKMWLRQELVKYVRRTAQVRQSQIGMTYTESFPMWRTMPGVSIYESGNLLAMAIGGPNPGVRPIHKVRLEWERKVDGSIELTYTSGTLFHWLDEIDWRSYQSLWKENQSLPGRVWAGVEGTFDVVGDGLLDMEFNIDIVYPYSIKDKLCLSPNGRVQVIRGSTPD